MYGGRGTGSTIRKNPKLQRHKKYPPFVHAEEDKVANAKGDATDPSDTSILNLFSWAYNNCVQLTYK